MAIDGSWALTRAEYGKAVLLLHKEITGKWKINKRLESPDTVSNGRIDAFDISGNTIALGVSKAAINGLEKVGAIYIYKKDDGGINNWGFRTRIVPDSIELQANKGMFGSLIALDDSLIVIKTANTDIDTLDAVTVFRENTTETAWNAIDDFYAIDDGHFFITTLSIDQGRVVIGDHTDKAYPQFNSLAGSVYIFDYQLDSNRWNLTTKIPAPNIGGGYLNFFGYAMDLQDETLVISAPFNFDRGAVYIYKKNKGGENNWGYVEELQYPYSNSLHSSFGHDVSISGNHILVGAERKEGINGSTGAVYLFEKTGIGTTWELIDEVLPVNLFSGDRFGYQVGISGDDLLVSAFGHDDHDGAIFVLSVAAYIELGSGVCEGESSSLAFHFPTTTVGPYQVRLQAGTEFSILSDVEDGTQIAITPDSTTYYELAWAVDANGDSIQTGLGAWIPVYTYPNAEIIAPEIGCIGDSIELKFQFEFPPETPILTIVFSRFHVYYTDGTQDYYVYANQGKKVKLPFTRSTSYWLKSITNASGCTRTNNFLSSSQHIIGVERPTARFSVDDKKCLREPIQVTFTGITATGSYYQWDFGPLKFSTTTTTTSYTYYDSGTHALNLIVTDPNNCKDTAYNEAIIYPKPHAYATVNNYCEKDTIHIQFTGTAIDGSIFTWTLNDEQYLPSDKRALAVYFANTGKQQVKLHVNNPYGCKDSIEFNFNVLANPLAQARLVQGKPKKLVSTNSHWKYQWYKNGVKIPKELGGQKREYTLTEVGDYYLDGINSFTCSNFSNTIHINDFVLGLFSKPLVKELKVWPNPTKGNLFIQLPEQVQSFKLKLTDMSGKTIYSKDYHQNNIDTTITLTEVDQVSQGLYMVTIMTKKGIWQSRIIFY